MTVLDAQIGAYISTERVRQTLMEMVDIASPTGGEKAMAEYIARRLEAAGLRTELQEVDVDRPNVVGTLEGTGEGYSLLFTGHMDTSYAGTESHLSGRGFRPNAVEEDGWIWGLGSNNMKSGLAASLVAVEALAQSGQRLKGDVVYAGVVGEIEKAPVEEFQGIEFSGYGAGSKHLVTHGVTADFALLSEPTGMQICTANMGCVWFRVRVRGTVSHSAFSRRPGIVNAIELMSQCQRDLHTWAEDYEGRHNYKGEHPNVTLAAIRGGDPWRLSRNPYDCSLYLEVRTIPGQSFEAIRRELRMVLRDFAARTGANEPELWSYVSDPAMQIDENLPIVMALSDAQRSETGETRHMTIRRPGADAVHFTAYGVPCVQFGPGMARKHPDAGERQIHEIGEHVFVDDVVAASRIYLATALDICNRIPSIDTPNGRETV